ncbi:MAG: hypothetical protein M1343_08370 [Chloroflexi bacterium]|nr:hypothetical protein [Chloroflexota bacterium]
MKHSLDIVLVTIDRTILDAALGKLPSVNDAAVWTAQYEVSNVVLDEKGQYRCHAMVRFHTSADRDAYFATIGALAGVLDGCLPGSMVRKHTCGHDDASACQEDVVYEVVGQ